MPAYTSTPSSSSGAMYRGPKKKGGGYKPTYAVPSPSGSSGYVPTSSSTTSSTSSSTASSTSSAQSAAAARAAKAVAQAAKTIASVVNEYGTDKKNPKSVSGKYAKESERVAKQRAREKAQMGKRIAKTVAAASGPKNTENLRPRVSTSAKGGRDLLPTTKSWEQGFLGRQEKKLGIKTTKPKVPPTPAEKATGAVDRVLGMVSGPKPRKVATRLEKAVSKAQPQFSGLDPEQQKVLGTVLSQGQKSGASNKAMLSAVETAIVESGIRNLDYGDADSQGWRQERSMYYPNPTNVKASANRYFQEAAAAQSQGQTPGQLAQATQQSAFPDRYDEVVGQAKPLLKDFRQGRAEAIPKPLKQKARTVLGKKPTKAILKGGEVIKAPKGKEKPSKADARWGGAVGAIHAVLPEEFWPDARGDKRTPEENAAVGGSATSDHLTTNTNSFGADLPPDDALAKQIADNLGLPGHTGLQTIQKDGVEYQLIWQAEGHYDHIHLGAEVIDPSNVPSAAPTGVKVKGTNLMVTPPTTPGSPSTTTSGGTTLPGGTTSAPSSPAEAAAQAAAERRRRQGPSTSKRLAAIDAWLTTPLTTPPEISQDLIDRILGK